MECLRSLKLNSLLTSHYNIVIIDRGSGFDAEDHDIKLAIGVQGKDSLRADKDYLITKDPDGDGLILKLLGNRRWTDLDNRTPPVSLILSSVTLSASTKELLVAPVIVAQVTRRLLLYVVFGLQFQLPLYNVFLFP